MIKSISSKKTSKWKSVTCLCVFLLTFCSSMVFAQDITVTGIVTDETNDPLPGVSVLVKGTARGTITDVDGSYTLNAVQPQTVITFSYIGFLSQEVTVGNQRTINIIMREDAQALEEVVVIGYGVQKKKLVTGATINVTGEDLQKLNTTSPLTALQSRVPGVTIIQNNGQPGAGHIVNIRGLGTNGEARPLYVVDGMPAGNDALSHMAASDIESIDILKDAASAAIYGARGANGVVLITTKQGKAGKPKIEYNGYYGQQYMSKKPDLLTAKEYILVQNERKFNSGEAPYDWANLLPKGMYDDVMNDKWKGSDWVDAYYNKGAVTQGHAFSLSGGSDASKFSMGYSFTQQDGIFGEAVQPKYNRHTFRLNSDHVLLKVRDFEAIKIGQTLNYSYRTRSEIPAGNMYWNGFTHILRANPLMPVYNEEGGYYDQNDKNRDGWNFEGAFGNPIASVALSSQGLNLYKNHGMRAGAYLQIQPIKGLVWRSQFGYNMSAYSGRTMSKMYYLSTQSQRTYETVDQSQSVGYNWSLDNTLTYNTLLNGYHNITAQLGQSVEKSGFGEDVSAGRNFSNFEGLGWDYAWVNNYIPTQFNDRWNGGGPWGEWAAASFFGRVLYNYKETYMLTALLRYEGSSNFAPGKRWGAFPSFSAGWIVSSEPFMEAVRGTLDFLKLTASWGQNGNQAISGFQYITRYNFPRTALYYFGEDAKNTEYSGAVPARLKNPNITWETQQMLDLGFDSRFLNNRLGLGFNYYNRETKGLLLEAPIAGTWGIGAPTINGGSVRNTGTELTLSWFDRVNDFHYNIQMNGSYNKNEVTEIANTERILHGSSNVLSQTTGEFTRSEVGKPFGFFYGWKTDGIFQNQAEVDAYVNDKGNPIIPGAKPGDVRFVDLNGDGQINDLDKTMIGSGTPKYHAGINLGANYKGFDFSVQAAGAFGFQIAKSYRSFADNETANYTTSVFERWTGEGTSNHWPRLTNGNHINYQYVSDIFLEKGDYLKIQSIIFGYDFKKLLPTLPLGQLRLYFQAQNLFTFTGYSGMDPEIGFGDGVSTVRGIDVGYYPSAKTFLFGISATF